MSAAPAPDGEPHLAVEGVDVRFGALQILFGVDLHVGRGEVVALLGTNGAGKSTLLRAITGLSRVTAGSITLNSGDVTQLPAADRVTAGLVCVSGGKGVFPGLTVSENLTLAGFTIRHDRERLEARRAAVLDTFPQLRERLSQRAGSLSGGQQQMLCLAKGLLLEPSILLIDELSLGLAPAVVQELLAVVDRLRSGGTTMLIVEQSLNIALLVADRAVFLEKGHVRFEGSAQELIERDDLARAVFFAEAKA